MRRRGCSSLCRKWRNFHRKLAYRIEETTGMARVERRGGARGGLGQTGVVPGSDRLRRATDRPAGCIVCASPPCRVRPMLHVLYLLPPEGPWPPLDHTRVCSPTKVPSCFFFSVSFQLVVTLLFARVFSSIDVLRFTRVTDPRIQEIHVVMDIIRPAGILRGSQEPGCRFTRKGDQRPKMDCGWEETMFCDKSYF